MEFLPTVRVGVCECGPLSASWGVLEGCKLDGPGGAWVDSGTLPFCEGLKFLHSCLPKRPMVGNNHSARSGLTKPPAWNPGLLKGSDREQGVPRGGLPFLK